MKIKGTAYWASINEHNSMSGKYQIDIGNLDKATVKALKAEGVNVKTDEPKEGRPDRGDFITCKTQYRPRVIDAKKHVMPKDFLIGNGSLINASVEAFSGTNKFGPYSGVNFKTVQVVKLVEYKGTSSDDEDFEEEEGFESTESAPEFEDDDDDL